MTDQYAIYRVNLLTEGKNLWQKSFEQVRKEHLPVRIDLYRQIHISFSEKDESVMEIWKKTRDITEVSDVLVLNRSGEISCYYVNEDAPRRITGFIRLNPSGTLVTLDTRDYKIEGYEGNWMAADDMIIDGRQFFLMEHQEFHRQAAMIVLDSYGRKVVEECKEGFNQEVKDKIYAFLQSQEKKRYPNKELKQRLEFWQKFFENGHYERSWESGMEVNYDAIDGCVNHQKDDPGKALKEPKDQPARSRKKTSVIRKLHQKQIAIAKRSGKPIPRYLEQQMVREKV